LHDALVFARSGDTLIVWKLDRLARSMKQLIETIEETFTMQHSLTNALTGLARLSSVQAADQ